MSRLESHLGFWLRYVSNHVSAAFAQALQARQLSVAEWVALNHIQEATGILPSALAEQMGLTRGAVSKIVDKLVNKGWATRSISLADSRSHILNLTAAGHALVPELITLADANDAQFFSCLAPHEQLQLRQLLQKMVRIHQWKKPPLE